MGRLPEAVEGSEPDRPKELVVPCVLHDQLSNWCFHRCARVHGDTGWIAGLAECCGADTPLGSHVRSELALRAPTTTRAYRTFRLERGVDVLSRVSMTPGSPRCPAFHSSKRLYPSVLTRSRASLLPKSMKRLDAGAV
jgi:hypothetical protein